MGFFSRIPLYARKALALLLNTGEFGRLSAEKTGMQNEQRQTINALASMQYELQKAYYEAERLKDELNAKEISLSQSISFLNELAARAEESETRFRLAGDGSNDGIWDWDLQKQKFYCAPSWLRIIGLPEDTILKPDELADLIHPDYLEPLWAAVRKALKSEELYFKHEMQVRHTNGHYVWVSLRARMARNEGGRVQRMAGTMTDTSQSKEYAARLQSSEHALLEAQKLAKIGSFNYNFVTKEFRYTSTYPMVYGCEDNEHFGKDAQFAIRFIHPDDLGHFKKVWDDALFENTELHVEYRVIKPSGEIGYVRCSGQPVFNEKNEQTGMVGTLQDITRERLMLEEALEARRIAEEATTAKTQFLSTMSHEIRTPMNAVIGFTRLLLLENPRPDQTEHLNTLRYSAEHLLSLINDILDYSKIDSGKVEFEQAPFSLSELLNDSLRMFRLRASEKKLDLSLKYEAALKHYLLGDTVRINQVLANLLANALKFTFKGTVILECSLASETDRYYAITFAVTDTGIGIPKNRQEVIFESFTQASSSTTRKFGGTGLGLAISRRLVELMGGHLTVDSTEGKGSVFSFTLRLPKGGTLPVSRPAELGAAPVAAADKEVLLLPDVKVLVVEDNNVNVMVAKKFLMRWKAQPYFAENGAEAVEMVRNNHYDIILMDLQMPVMDGFEASKTIRSLPGERFKKIPIVALTASASPNVRTEVLEAGMNDYITKPFNPNELHKLMASLVHISEPS